MSESKTICEMSIEINPPFPCVRAEIRFYAPRDEYGEMDAWALEKGLRNPRCYLAEDAFRTWVAVEEGSDGYLKAKKENRLFQMPHKVQSA